MLNPNGDVFFCENSDVMGNVKDEDPEAIYFRDDVAGAPPDDPRREVPDLPQPVPDERGGHQAGRAVRAVPGARLDGEAPRRTADAPSAAAVPPATAACRPPTSYARLRMPDAPALRCPQTLSVLVPVYNERATIERLLTAGRVGRTPASRSKSWSATTARATARATSSRSSRCPASRSSSWPRTSAAAASSSTSGRWRPATSTSTRTPTSNTTRRTTSRCSQPILHGSADVVYGSRFKGSIEKMRWLNRMGNLVDDRRRRARSTACRSRT